MYAFPRADSVHSPLLPSFHRARRTLLAFASAAAIAIATMPSGALADGKYFMADGSKTNDFEEAATSWRTPEFLKDHALAGVKAEYAYALGFTGKSVVLGEVDSGVLAFHPQLSGKVTSLTVTGIYGAYGWRYESGNRNRTWKAGDKFSIAGDYDVLINDSHGTAAAGEMVARRDATSVKATLARNGVPFESVGSTYNERALLRGIDSAGFGNPLHDMIVVADNREMPAAVAAGISEGLVATTIAGVLAKDASVIGNAAKNRIRAAFDGVAVKEQAVIASPLAYAPAQRAKTSDAFAAVAPVPRPPCEARRMADGRMRTAMAMPRATAATPAASSPGSTVWSRMIGALACSPVMAIRRSIAELRMLRSTTIRSGFMAAPRGTICA
ncbi:hypothetical protein DEV91_101431 [Phyllobacterium brassicacearum]|nr:hypothetical protein DEV91_101431 [Phyllobacterium brassicacearum]